MTEDELEAHRQAIGAATKAEARRILAGISEDRLEALIRKGELRAIRCGARVLIPFSAIREYLEGGKPLPQRAKKAPPPV